jgi:hypothetical protein
MVTSAFDFSEAPSITLEDLEELIKEALRKTGLAKELDLCSYLFDCNERLSPTTYLELKDTDRKTLYKLIKENILEINFHEFSSKRVKTPEKLAYTGQSLEECIREAMVRLNVQRETAMCKYIPYEKGHLHHFTYLKMKSSNPIQLRNLIKMHILDQRPQLLPPMKRKQYVFQNSRQSTEHQFHKPEEDVEAVIQQAMQRSDLNLEEEEDLCRYLPRGDSFLHPLGFRSLKRNNPRELSKLIRDYVLIPIDPKPLEWKKIDRYPSNFKPMKEPQQEKSPSLAYDRIDQLLEAVNSLTKTLQISKTEGVTQVRHPSVPNQHSSRKIPEKCFQMIQADLIAKILKREVDLNLWTAYVELLAFDK